MPERLGQRRRPFRLACNAAAGRAVPDSDSDDSHAEEPRVAATAGKVGADGGGDDRESRGGDNEKGKEDEQVAPLARSELALDPLLDVQVQVLDGGVLYPGAVIDIDIGLVTRTRLYLVELGDGDRLHLTAPEVRAAMAKEEQDRHGDYERLRLAALSRGGGGGGVWPQGQRAVPFASSSSSTSTARTTTFGGSSWGGQRGGG